MIQKPENLSKLQELKASLPPGVLNVFYEMGGTDQLLLFTQYAYEGRSKRGGVGRAYIAAEYAPEWVKKNTGRLSNSPAVQYLRRMLLRLDNAQFADVDVLSMQTLREVMKSSADPKARVAAARVALQEQRVRMKDSDALDVKVQRAMEKAAVAKPGEFTDEQLVVTFSACAKLLSERGHNPNRILAEALKTPN